MIKFEDVLQKRRPDLVIVFGDVNSTLACALSSVKLHIPVAHVEAGMRSFDRTMPEEINRVLTDHISDYLFTTSRYDDSNLKKEGIQEDRIHLVGNVMMDSLKTYANQAQDKRSKILASIGFENADRIESYALMTLHRPSNVDERGVFMAILSALAEVSKAVPIIFPAHPRTRQRIQEFGFGDLVSFFDEGAELKREILQGRINVIPPLGYLDFIGLAAAARMVLTDSGGIQAETTLLGVPCLTLRENTEWTITLEQGTNHLVGIDPGKIKEKAFSILESESQPSQVPELWDGRTSKRIAKILADRL
jgi:UDP-N-acetylglucosamine 2-epimerase (non-hydrolysing)